MTDGLREEQRENWGTRAGFVLAAIGSAIGLGNLWGFPYKLYTYGGGAFLIPYILAMVVVGIPLLIAEFSLGHLTQRATPDAFGRANRKFAFVGWWQIILSFIIVTYYAIILAYCVSFVGYSIQGIFTGELPWAGKGIEGVAKAKSFFFDDYLGQTDGFALGRLQVHILGALVITWVAMYLCIFRGVRLVGKIVMWTVPLPWLMLLILTVRGMTLDGAMQGLEYYLEPNWTRLANPTTWRWAFGQMFFSMSLAFGIMITYSSFLHRKSDLNNNAAIIGLADLGTSFVAGLAVFATLGGMAYATQAAGQAVPVEAVTDSGPGLAFVAFPYALAQLPHAPWFSLLFFGSLLLLGIDSAFSITESVLASLVDKTGWSREKVLIGLTLAGFAIGVVYSTQAGLNWLGMFDDLINGTWGITLTALLECVVLGWLFRLSRLRDHANERSDWRIGRWWDWLVRVVIPVLLAGLFSWSLFDNLSDPSGYVYIYETGKKQLAVPVPESLPDRPMLEVQFAAEYSGESEHTLTLNGEKPDTLESWTLLPPADDAPREPIEVPTTGPMLTTAPTEATGLGEDFDPREFAGRKLGFTTAGAKPGTLYSVRYRWKSRPELDPKTGLAAAEDDTSLPDWEPLTRLETERVRAGVNVGRAVGLGVMALAPIVAIVLATLRFRRRRHELIQLPYRDEAPRGRGVGVAGIVLAVVSLAAAGLLTVVMLQFAANLRVRGLAEVPGWLGGTTRLLAVGFITAVLAMLAGGASIAINERRQIRASMLTRLAAAGAVIGLGLHAGLALAHATLAVRFPAARTVYDNELSGISYVILAAMLALIVVGLGWCFYRALRAAGGEEDGEVQYAEDVEG